MTEKNFGVKMDYQLNPSSPNSAMAKRLPSTNKETLGWCTPSILAISVTTNKIVTVHFSRDYWKKRKSKTLIDESQE